MALDVYVGSLTRYYTGDWENVADRTARVRSIAENVDQYPASDETVVPVVDAELFRALDRVILDAIVKCLRAQIADVAETALHQSANKIDPLFAKVDVRVVDEMELKSAGFSPEMFRNLNTPEDLTEAYKT